MLSLVAASPRTGLSYLHVYYKGGLTENGPKAVKYNPLSYLGAHKCTVVFDSTVYCGECEHVKPPSVVERPHKTNSLMSTIQTGSKLAKCRCVFETGAWEGRERQGS
ncbi:hypothetical protein PGT21_000196 [Puccinia graminis f. sp. tritici]|uniref:Uncharacterized protein n=2 Tax=Puccinia graminis f. sp. tritici TaxID=56615 RepID=A0A5B0M8W4_PUCGR|nr:hypothetical protein PGT21_026826 [Puccinia graminis f. sp. tritici]KAA1069388.1 hypothetical protein PGT21_022970 [Puccinia graminis f. sp. tritici]KAA1072603.1 hypothetical protein PGT21_000196 [Puccinia graminis f. sp. tritici]KAA1072736.1 hypothetical protein PGTUg99_024981 [Puccinia graminis f. sp. tritici]KAA1073829.1 hypothetical protein PGTUg99_000737 [Puccinia graminis f. sp. tritici]